MLSKDQVHHMVNQYNSGMSINDIAKYHNLTFTKVYRRLIQAGCKFRSKGRYSHGIDERGRKIYEMLKLGKTRDEICETLKINYQMFYRSCYREDYIIEFLKLKYKKTRATIRVPNYKHTDADIIVSKDGNVISKLNNKPIKVYKAGRYYMIKLDKPYYLHVLLAEKYIGRPSKYHIVMHKDGDSTNNSLENLEFVTRHSFAYKFMNKHHKH